MAARVLVVDDNLINRKLACSLLTMEGYVVQSCEDAEEVLRVLPLGAPDIILMDIGLPGMDGLALTRLLKADPRYAELPIIAMTAFTMKGDERKALDAGCNGYIAKPIDTRQLASQVQAYLDEAERRKAQLKVMIVEDHRIDMKLAGERVRLSGHLVLSNTTAEQALESLSRQHPDVVLLDLNLPGMDGLSFVKLVKQDPATAMLPVVAVTAYPDRFQREDMLAAGCAAYLVKPVEARQLLAALEEALRQAPDG
ncbi:response regulator [Piscinibacter terrae]|uniref:Response regulator n=1 Tax=Piscinibacter terrae TaxID=2496871 RepID=A0A3N7IXQ1_9BURK|nr:response regulator [Albitalea terrae]RQP23542.1 response regulator [Albitalea terrae]